MRWIKNSKKSAGFIMLAAAFSLGVLVASAAGDINEPEISIQLSAGQLITDNRVTRPTGFVFTAEVTAKTAESLPFESVCLATPAGITLTLEEAESGGLFAFSRLYTRSSHFEEDHGRLGGQYTLIFDRDTPEETALVIDYPYTSFYNDFAMIIFPEHEDVYAPLQMVVKWDMVPQWRDYDGIVVSLDKRQETTQQLFTSKLLSSRETSLNLEKQYAILETDTPHNLTVKLVNMETGETTTQDGAYQAEYTVSRFAASRVFFITTPDYYIGNSSADTTCFIHSVKHKRQ